MEYTGAEREFGNFQMNPNDEVPTEISNSDEELLNSFDPTVLVRLEHGNIWGIPRHIYSVSCQSWRNLDEILL